jgi:hypothetical protein
MEALCWDNCTLQVPLQISMQYADFAVQNAMPAGQNGQENRRWQPHSRARHYEIVPAKSAFCTLNNSLLLFTPVARSYRHSLICMTYSILKSI